MLTQGPGQGPRENPPYPHVRTFLERSEQGMPPEVTARYLDTLTKFDDPQVIGQLLAYTLDLPGDRLIKSTPSHPETDRSARAIRIEVGRQPGSGPAQGR